MGSDLIITGKYGVLNQQKLLNSTSNNINNVNTEGFIRKETQTYTSCVDWGVGGTYTRRIYDKFVQRQMYADGGHYNYYSALSTGLDATDRILSNDDMSIANAMTSYFDALSTAASLPTSAANRNAAMAQLDSLVKRFTTANESMFDSLVDINNRISDSVVDINSYTQAISNINFEIRSKSLSTNEVNNEIYLQMLDERDRLIDKLSSLVNVNVVEANDGTYEVYLDQGMLLANGDVYAVLNEEINQFDSTRREIYMSYTNIADSGHDHSYVQLSVDNVGGSLGGYLNATQEIRLTMKELGKLAASFSDAINVQNKAGFTLENIAGDKLINLETIQGKSTGNIGVSTSFIEGLGENVQGYDFEVSFVNGALHVYKIGNEKNGKIELDASELPSPLPTGNVLRLESYGIEIKFGDTIANLVAAAKDRFYVQPTFMCASTMKMNLSKPEDFAFASAVRTRTSPNNYGNAVISLASCTNTGTDFGVYVDPTTHLPNFHTDAPQTIKTDAAGDYHIYDGSGNQIGKAPATCKGINIFANAEDMSGDPFDRGIGYPGYDINISGTVKENDTFSVEINSDAQADNSNANFLVALRSAALTRTSGSSKTTTLNEGYANLLAQLGSAQMSATSNTDAAKAKYDQTVEMYESSSGVNLDEEATNLLMFQQSYQACAKIIEASQTIFNALIQSF